MAVRLRRHNGGAAVYVKLSAPYRLAAGLGPIELGKLWQDELGPHALLWGSDWPFTNHESVNTYPQLHAALADWLGTHPDIAHQVRSVNPTRLYEFTAA